MNTKIKLSLHISLLTVFSFLFFGELRGTNQIPDKIQFDNSEMDLRVGYAYPSPLEVYYYQNNLEYPFKMLSTGNYRGFIARWEIKEKKLFLNKVLVERKELKLKKLNIKSTNRVYNKKEVIFADWFSGVIECSFRKKDNPNYIIAHFFQIKNGVIVDTERAEGKLGSNDDDSFHNNLKKVNLWKMYWDYMGCYFRLKDDVIILNGKEGRLNLSRTKHSPLLAYYGKSIANFKFNWENRKKNGHPYSTWIIQDQKIYLKDITLRYGNRFDTVYTHQIDMKDEFKSKYQADKVFADWINGVLLLKFGKMIREKVSENYERDVFEVSKFVFIRVKNGQIMEQHEVDGKFDFDKFPKHIKPKLKRIIKEYN